MAGVSPHATDSVTRIDPPLVAAHYFGRHWPKNFINAFRYEHVAEDFAQLRADGFNAVVLLVAWGDFQPTVDPCCDYDERAFQRMHYLIDAARDAGLEAVLRVGYAWSFHPDAGNLHARQAGLLNEQPIRDAFLEFVGRLGAEMHRHPNLRLSFMSWEDQELHQIMDSAQDDFNEFLDTLPPDDPLRSLLPEELRFPTKNDPSAPLFHRYRGYLLMEKIMRPAVHLLHPLSYEVRVDRDPLPLTRPDGSTTYQGISHEHTYQPPGADVLTIYWAPFWGAQNQGEELSADLALRLFRHLLAEVNEHSGHLPIFIDQFNVIDNTVGAEQNAVLRNADLASFMQGAHCAMRKAGVFGCGYWTVRNYAESPLFNPSFNYGLEGVDTPYRFAGRRHKSIAPPCQRGS